MAKPDFIASEVIPIIQRENGATIFEAGILSRLENLRQASNNIAVPSFDLLYAVSELKSRLFE